MAQKLYEEYRIAYNKNRKVKWKQLQEKRRSSNKILEDRDSILRKV